METEVICCQSCGGPLDVTDEIVVCKYCNQSNLLGERAIQALRHRKEIPFNNNGFGTMDLSSSTMYFGTVNYGSSAVMYTSPSSFAPMVGALSYG